MRRFRGVLEQVSDGLDLPQPTKSRILLEMAGDLEDLYEHHRSRGLDEIQAAEAAEEAFGASDEALKRLSRVHESGGRFSDRLARQVGSPWERALLVVWLLAVVAVTFRVVTAERFFLMVSPFVWPIVALAAVAFLFTLRKLHELFVRKPADVRRLRSGLSAMLFFAGASLAISACGLLYHLRWWAYHTYEASPEAFFSILGPWLAVISSMMILGLLTAILTALAWFLLVNLVARVERREATALLA